MRTRILSLPRILADLRARVVSPVSTSDAQLLERFVRLRDESAFAELMHRHGGMVLGVARRQLSDCHAAEDVFQATFLALARQAFRLRRELSLQGWLYTVGHRLARKERVRAARRPRPLQEGSQAFESNSADGDPLARISGSEMVAIIDDELARLPRRYRLPVLLCGLDGVPREDAASRLGWSLGTLRGRLERGRELLRGRLSRRGLTAPTLLAASTFATPADAVSPALITATTRAALAVPCATAHNVTILALAAALVATLGIGIGAVCLLSPRHGGPLPQRAASASARVDAFGDPLPERALRRFGTVRFRHGEQVHSFALASDGATAATGGYGSVRIWDTTTRKLRRTLPANGFTVQALGFSTDGSRLLTAGNADNKDQKIGQLIVWDLQAGKPLWTVAAAPILSAALTPDGKTVALSCSDGSLRTLDASTGKVRRTLGAPGEGSSRVGLSPDGKQLAGVRDGALRIWDVASGAERLRLPGVRSLYAMAFSPSGKSLVTAEVNGHDLTEDATIRLWDLATGKAKWSVPSEQQAVLSIAFSPDSQWLATGGIREGSVVLRETTSGRAVRKHHELDGWMHGVAFSPDGQYLYAAGTNGRVLVWGTTNGHIRFPDDQHTSGLVAMSLSQDGRTLATAGADRTIRLWDLGSGKTRMVLRGHEQAVYSVHLLPGVRRLVSAGGDGTVRVWDTATGRELRKLVHVEKGWNARTVLSPDGKLLAIGEVQRVRLWDISAGKEVRQLAGHTGYLMDLSFSADGALLATTAHSYGAGGKSLEDHTVRVWQVATGEELFRQTILYPNCPLFTSDGRGVACLGGRSAHVFDFRSNQKRPSPGWEDVQTMAASCGGAWLATAHEDGSIRVRAASSGQEVLRYQADVERTYGLLWSADGKRLYSAHADSTVLEWDLTPSAGGGLLMAEQAWSDLASANGPTAYRAAWWFLTTTNPTAALEPRLRAVPKGDKAEGIRRLIAQLDDDTFAVREAAVKELKALGPAAEPALTRAADASASLEVRRRIRAILEQSAAREMTADEWRNLRAVEVLERVGSAEARRVLVVLSEGEHDAQLTRAAVAALGRLRSSSHD